MLKRPCAKQFQLEDESYAIDAMEFAVSRLSPEAAAQFATGILEHDLENYTADGNIDQNLRDFAFSVLEKAGVTPPVIHLHLAEP